MRKKRPGGDEGDLHPVNITLKNIKTTTDKPRGRNFRIVRNIGRPDIPSVRYYIQDLVPGSKIAFAGIFLPV